MKNYRVIWFDDEFRTLETFIDDAKVYNIDLVGYDNAEYGINELKQNHLSYQAVIVDGLFFEKPDQSGDATESTAFGIVARELRSLKDKGIVIPWFILSGQHEFVKSKNVLIPVLSDKDFAKGVVFEKTDEGFENLCKTILKTLSELPEIKVKNKFERALTICTDEYIGDETKLVLIKLLVEMEENDSIALPSFDYFTSVRKIFEKLFEKLTKTGLIPDEIFTNPGWINSSSHFICGTHSECKIQEGVIHPMICQMIKNIIQIVQDGSHTVQDKLKLKADQYSGEIKTGYLFRSIIFQLLDILIYFKDFIDNNPDYEKNKLLCIQLKTSDEVIHGEWIKGKISEIQSNGWGNFIGKNGLKVGIPSYMVKQNNLKLDDLVQITTKPGQDAKNSHVDKIQKL